MSATVAVCVPARDMVHTGFMLDLVHAVAQHATTSRDQILTKVSRGTLLVDQRNTLVEESLEDGATHVLWVDSDMRFPSDLIKRLLERDVDIVAANCSRRRPPAAFIALKVDEDGPRNVQTLPDSTGLEEVTAIGFGVMMVKREVFEKMPKPWHQLVWNTRDERFVGEDAAWCFAAQDLGFKVHIDHDISKEILHTGTHDYGCEDVWNGIE